jgi:hypothetical protein
MKSEKGFEVTKEEVEQAEKEIELGEIWKPKEKGEQKILKFVNVKNIDYLEKQPNLYQFTNSEGELINMWETYVIKSQFESKGIGVGDILLIRYEGKKESKDHQDYHNFSISIVRATE